MGDGTILLVFLPDDEIFSERDHKVYETILADILLFTVICALTAVLLFERVFAAGCALMAAAVLSAYIAGRLWYGEREVRVHTDLDPDPI